MQKGELLGIAPVDGSATQHTISKREAMGMVFDAVAYGDVEEALESVYAVGLNLGSVLVTKAHDLVKDVLTEDALETLGNNPIDVLGLEYHLLQMNHPYIWLNLLQKANARNPEVKRGMMESFIERVDPPLEIPEDPTSLFQIVSGSIVTANLKLFARQVAFYGLAAAFGNEFEQVVDPKERYKLLNGDIHPNNRYVAGLEVANHFGTRAESPAQAIERLQELYPPNPIKGGPAFQTALGKRAFINPSSRTASGIATCPATDPTRMIFGAYGNLLDQQDFRDRLAVQISRK